VEDWQSAGSWWPRPKPKPTFCAEALTLYRAGQQVMTRELGLELGAWLRGLYQRILDDEPVQFGTVTAA
jgi:hypothetical protein